jgi:hypothetical protein
MVVFGAAVLATYVDTHGGERANLVEIVFNRRCWTLRGRKHRKHTDWTAEMRRRRKRRKE